MEMSSYLDTYVLSEKEDDTSAGTYVHVINKINQKNCPVPLWRNERLVKNEIPLRGPKKDNNNVTKSHRLQSVSSDILDTAQLVFGTPLIGIRGKKERKKIGALRLKRASKFLTHFLGRWKVFVPPYPVCKRYWVI